MQNVALTEDIRKLDAERERQLRELAQRKDAALLQMRTASFYSWQALEVEDAAHPKVATASPTPKGNVPVPVSI